MAHCPNCWSGVDALVGDCPHCGLPLGRPAPPRRRLRWVALVLLAATGAAIAVVALRISGGTSGDGRATSDPSESATATGSGGDALPADTATIVSDARGDALPRYPVHLVLDDGEGRTVAALALAGPVGPRLLLPIRALLTAGSLRHEGRPFDALVAHADPVAGFALLEPVTPLPEAVRPLRPGAWTATAPAAALVAPDGTRTPIGPMAPGPAGRLRVREDAPVGSAVVDTRDTAVAYVEATGSAITLGPVLAWLGAPGSTSLADARLALRSADPRTLLEDAEARLASPDLDLASARAALDALLRAETLARDRALFDRILDALPVAFAQVVVRELAQDPDAALARGRSALARFGDDPDLLAVTAQAAAAVGEPGAALDLVARLRVTDPAKAEIVLRSIERACLTFIDRASSARRHDDAVAVAARLTDLAPMRPDLLAAHARALEAAGRIADALVIARRAAALDEAHSGLVAALAEALEQPGGVVRVPYDPRSGAIRAEVHVGTRLLPMVVDTGATLTTVPTAIARELGLITPDARQIDVETANGRVRGTLVRLPSLRIGALELRNVQAVALDLPGALAGEGLLGLSALRRVDVQLDAEAGEIVFRRRERR